MQRYRPLERCSPGRTPLTDTGNLAVSSDCHCSDSLPLLSLGDAKGRCNGV